MSGFSEEELKIAFWKTFYKQGEVFFDYMGSDEDCDYTVIEYWNDFLDYLKEGK